MRRAVYRSGWLVLLCLLLLAFSVPAMPAAPDMAEAQPSSPAVATTSTDCATGTNNHTELARRSWVDKVLTNAVCEPTPSTVLIARSSPT